METAAPTKLMGRQVSVTLPKSGGLDGKQPLGEGRPRPISSPWKLTASPTRALLDHTTHHLRPEDHLWKI